MLSPGRSDGRAILGACRSLRAAAFRRLRIWAVRAATCPRSRRDLVWGITAAIAAWSLGSGAAAQADTGMETAPTVDSATGDSAQKLEEVTVTAERLQLLGTASTASEGVIDDQELQLSPQFRPGQLLETVPGLIATTHSGEGKADQYLLRGYNLDHGTDLATYLDGMPINLPTHAHGQGYTDLNFMFPELAETLTYTKGPYYADVGDFGAVGSVHINYRDTIPAQLSASVGTLGYERLFGAGSLAIGDGNLLAAVEAQHYDGPFLTPDDSRKENLVLRYSAGDEQDGYALTGMLYHNLWTATNVVDLRAISEGFVPDRFATLNPTDGGRASRASLSFNDHASLGEGQFSASSYFIDNQLHMWNDFTYFLVDPAHGDQEDQFENRRVLGTQMTYARAVQLGAITSELSAGLVARYDMLRVGRLPSEDRVPLPVSGDPPSFSNDDQVYLFAGGAYVQAITHWNSRVRSVLGIREDFQRGTDVDYLAALHTTAGYTNAGTAQQSLPQPKGSLIYTPATEVEFYLSAGEGFHSADLRGVNQDKSVDLGLPNTPLLAKQEGEEVGMRAALERDLAFTVAMYNLWQQSETIFDPDVGEDSAGPPSRRYGFEFNATYQIRRWLELYGSFSANHARFTHPLNDGTGHLGDYIANAPREAASLALYVMQLGPWSGGAEYRYLGGFPLSAGPCVNSAAVEDFPGEVNSCANAPTAAGQVNGGGFGELNLDVRYAFSSGWNIALGIYNALNTHAYAMEFWGVDRLQSEISSYPEGRAGVQEHPLAPFSVRFMVSKRFGL
jgi:hypothetical protein